MPGTAIIHSLTQHRAQIEAILASWGLPAGDAGTIADVLTWADLHGIDSHGFSMLPSYDTLRRAGTLNMAARPSIVQETPVSAVVDAQGGLGHPAALFSIDLAMEKARKVGMAAVAVRNSGHYGACGFYTKRAVSQGFIAMTTTTTPGVSVAPSGGAEARLGTDPWSMAAPGAPDRPFLLDMATTTVASGKVRNKWVEGLPLPSGWINNKDGQPSTDAADFVERGGYHTPLGGTPEGSNYKGTGLAAMARILSAGLAGSPLLLDKVNKKREIAHFFFVLDPNLFRAQDEFEGAVADFCDSLRATRPVNPEKPVMVAGDPERAIAAQRTRDGVPIAPGLFAKVRTLAENCGAPWLLD
jgi:LDH2 family malate/lactate/ureidoglycolate dehydrogenase